MTAVYPVAGPARRSMVDVWLLTGLAAASVQNSSVGHAGASATSP